MNSFFFVVVTLGSSIVIINATSVTQDGSTLIITWQLQASPNGEILNVIVRIILYSNGQIIHEENVPATVTTYTAFELSEPVKM